MKSIIISLMCLALFSCSKTSNNKVRSATGTVTMNIDGAPFSSDMKFSKTIAGTGYNYTAGPVDIKPIVIRILNDSIYQGQVITGNNWFDNQSNGIQFYTYGLYGAWFYNDQYFIMNVNTVINNEASGTFSGNLIGDYPGGVLDTMVISNGVFTNVPVEQ